MLATGAYTLIHPFTAHTLGYPLLTCDCTTASYIISYLLYLVIPIQMQQDHLPCLLGQFAVIFPILAQSGRDFHFKTTQWWKWHAVSLRKC